jgi:hypothetical protein
MAYATLDELRAFVGIPADDPGDDAPLQVALDAAAEQIDSWTQRTFTIDATVVERVFVPGAADVLDIDPTVADLTGLVVATDDDYDGVYETEWTAGTDYIPYPYGTGQPWTRIFAIGTRRFPMRAHRPTVSVTAKFGWPGDVPAAVKEANLIQASRLFVRRNAPFGIAGSPELGSEIRLLARLDPDVEALLRPYRRMWWFG